MKIVPALDRDFATVYPILDQLMAATRDRRAAMWNELRNVPGYAAWVAEEDGKAVGFLDVLIWPDVAHGEWMGLINNLVIDERQRGQGLGEGLLREAIQHCERRGVMELHVWTDFDNKPAIGLYRKLGFMDRSLLLELNVRPP